MKPRVLTLRAEGAELETDAKDQTQHSVIIIVYSTSTSSTINTTGFRYCIDI